MSTLLCSPLFSVTAEKSVHHAYAEEARDCILVSSTLQAISSHFNVLTESHGLKTVEEDTCEYFPNACQDMYCICICSVSPFIYLSVSSPICLCLSGCLSGLSVLTVVVSGIYQKASTNSPSA